MVADLGGIPSVNSRQDSAYRLLLARQYLDEAEQDLALRRWRSAVAGAQMAVENAAKAVVACFGPVPRSHDLADRLQVVTGADMPQAWAEEIKAMLPIVLAYDTEFHIRASYGDEQAFRSPWELFGEDEARRGVEVARRCLATAESVHTHFFPKPEEEDAAHQA
ncbi:MAG: HEPN domain-containing protein [Anaerolineae bacterium]